jgi:uncharacterized membrane protein
MFDDFSRSIVTVPELKLDTQMTNTVPRKILIALVWIALLGLSINFYLDNAVAYFFGYRNPRFGDTLFSNQLWFVVHIAGGTCALFLGPIQFWTRIRERYTKLHRLIGKIYIVGSLIAGIIAIKLSLINGCQACRYSLLTLAVLWIFFTIAAYLSIRRFDIEAHRKFMVRSYVCALAFVFVRVPGVLPMDFFFSMIDSPTEQGIVAEWFFSLVPLFVAEFWLTWLPALRGTAGRATSQAI